MTRTIYSIGYVTKKNKKTKKKFIRPIFPIVTQNEYFYSSKFVPSRTKHVPYIISRFVFQKHKFDYIMRQN